MKMNPVVHFEMPGEDMARMSKFYTEAFGWETNTMGAEMGHYVVVSTTETEGGPGGRPKNPGAINGGFFPKTAENSHPSVVISVEDINSAIEKVKAAGGTINDHPVEIPGIGMYVSCTDTEGNRVSILQPSGM